MPMTAWSKARAACQLFIVVMVFAAALLLSGVIETAWAQNSPFGGLRSGGGSPPASAAGIVGWLFAKQAEFYRQFSGLIRSAKADDSAAWSLLGVSFLYGVFHAAGPGHCKAVISSYVVANGETWTRGVVLSLAAALLQAFAAIAIVGVAAVLLHARASTMNRAVNLIESASYALIIIIGVRLLWVKGRIFLSALRATRPPISEVGAAVTLKLADRDHDEEDHGHGIHSPPPARHGHAHADRECACGAGHIHAPPLEELGGVGGWRRGLTAIVAVGLRPCSGAILVLVLAMAQGLFWVGAGSALAMGLGTFITVATIATVAVMARDTASRLAAARSRHGALAMRGIEVAAAAAITGFGVLLLCGYLVNERMIGL
jgi:nickel/cobalt transporter (NicO) family protein